MKTQIFISILPLPSFRDNYLIVSWTSSLHVYLVSKMKSSSTSLTHDTFVFYEAGAWGGQCYLPPISRAQNPEALSCPSPSVATSGCFKSCNFYFINISPICSLFPHTSTMLVQTITKYYLDDSIASQIISRS